AILHRRAPSRSRSEASRWWTDVVPCVAESQSGWKQSRRCAARRVQLEVASAFAGDAPASVMQLHVVISAEQDPAVDVGSTAVGMPLVDMVRLAIGGWTVASLPTAAAIAYGEGDALSRREQAVLAADIQWIPATVDRYGHRRVADALIDDRRRQVHEAVLGVRTVRVALHMNQPHAGLPGAEDGLGIGQRPGA